MTGPSLQSVAELVRQFRVRAGVTLEQLSDMSGLSVRTLSNVERGVSRGPRRDTLALISDALQLTPDERAALGSAVRSSRKIDRANDSTARLADFTGRHVELAMLAERLGASAGTGVITGPAGIGKTELAMRLARDLQPSYPDGVVFCELRGDTSTLNSPYRVMRRVMLTLGTPPPAVPRADADLAAAYGGVLRSSSAVVIFDGATERTQLAPLLTIDTGSALLVTSRDRLDRFDDVTHLELGPVAMDESVELLEAILRAGGRTARDDADQLALFAAACDHSPLAMRIAAARLCSRPLWPIGFMIERLQAAETTPWVADSSERGLAAAIDVSFGQLSEPAQQVLRAMPCVPGADMSAELVAIAMGEDLDGVEAALAELVLAGFVQLRRSHRYLEHGAVRSLADEVAGAAGLMTTATVETTERAVVWLLTMLASAATAIEQHVTDERQDFASSAAAFAWLDLERDNWLAALELTLARRQHELLVGLPASVGRYFALSGNGDALQVIAHRPHVVDH